MKSIHKGRLVAALGKLDGITYERVNGAIVCVKRHGSYKVGLYGWCETGDHFTMGVISSPQTDIMTDCFCDTYLHTIRGIFEACS